jgi:hypothetical protein
MLPNAWNILNSDAGASNPFFVNSTAINVVATVTVQGPAPAIGQIPIPFVARPIAVVDPNGGAYGVYPGTQVAIVSSGQTVTIVCDIPANGGYLCTPAGADAGKASLMMYEVEDLLWGRG